MPCDDKKLKSVCEQPVYDPGKCRWHQLFGHKLIMIVMKNKISDKCFRKRSYTPICGKNDVRLSGYFCGSFVLKAEKVFTFERFLCHHFRVYL